MPPSVMILGPSKWLDPDMHLKEMSPLDRRKATRYLLKKVFGIPAVVLEEEKQRDGENNFDFFLRVVKDHDVRTFMLYWPHAARLDGLAVEIGYLLTRLNEGSLDPVDVHVVVDARVVKHAHGVATGFVEIGNRTRYYEDLIARGCLFATFEDEPGIGMRVIAVAREHVSRYPAEREKPEGGVFVDSE